MSDQTLINILDRPTELGCFFILEKLGCCNVQCRTLLHDTRDYCKIYYLTGLPIIKVETILTLKIAMIIMFFKPICFARGCSKNTVIIDLFID